MPLSPRLQELKDHVEAIDDLNFDTIDGSQVPQIQKHLDAINSWISEQDREEHPDERPLWMQLDDMANMAHCLKLFAAEQDLRRRIQQIADDHSATSDSYDIINPAEQ